eukprot:Gb_27992 [translate_table: standard]
MPKFAIGGGSNSRDIFLRGNMRKSKPINMRQRRSDIEGIDFTTRIGIICNDMKLYYIVGEIEDLVLCWALEYYDKSYDQITPKSEKRLECFKNWNFFKVTTTNDHVIRRNASEDKDTVFATNTILATLMCAPRGGQEYSVFDFYFDEADEESFHLVDQKLHPKPEFAQVLVRDGNKVEFEEKKSFTSKGEEVDYVAYRYKGWKLDDDISMVARYEVHSVMDAKGHTSFLTLNSLNEFDPKFFGVDWRQELETQWGVVLATKIKNNANTLAKWITQALLASVDVMKLGYVLRIHP